MQRVSSRPDGKCGNPLVCTLVPLRLYGINSSTVLDGRIRYAIQTKVQCFSIISDRLLLPTRTIFNLSWSDRMEGSRQLPTRKQGSFAKGRKTRPRLLVVSIGRKYSTRLKVPELFDPKLRRRTSEHSDTRNGLLPSPSRQGATRDYLELYCYIWYPTSVSL
jgi:hypothetical protein